jgi:hypothetical protein
VFPQCFSSTGTADNLLHCMELSNFSYLQMTSQNQTIYFTRRRSGVRVPARPPKPVIPIG